MPDARLEQARPGNRLGDISHAIQRHAEKHRYGVVRDFCGHGLGRLFHDSPEVVHAGRPGTGPELKPGMFFTVEPMINIGRADVKLLDDGWTAVTRDRSLSAQFEHSIGITEDGCEIFTKSPKGLDKPPLCAAASWAQTPVDQLARPSADARHYVIISTAGKHGEASEWTAADGTRMGRFSLVLRGQVWEVDEASRYGADGMLSSYVLRGASPQGDVGETFSVAGGKAIWKSPIDGGSAAYSAPAFYLGAGPGVRNFNDVLERLIAAPDHSLALLPGGRARLEPLTTATVGNGPDRRKLIAYAITGVSNTAIPIWATEDGKFFASVGVLSTIPVGYEDAQAALEKAQDEALAARSPVLARKLARIPAGPVAFTNVRAFVDGSRFAEGQTVLVDKGRIVAVGPAASVRVPAGAQVIDGRGKTLVPGLWDSHMHFGDDSTGPMLLSLGITSARDPGNVTGLTLAREEAIAAVRKAKANGMTGVKFYGTLQPGLAAGGRGRGAPSSASTSTAIFPAGMRTLDAINAGYDEITHIYFAMMQAMPDEVVAKSNGIMRF
jgi:hypothetical protein